MDPKVYRKAAKMNNIHMGDVTHHQDQFETGPIPANFRVKNIRNNMAGMLFMLFMVLVVLRFLTYAPAPGRAPWQRS